MAQNNQVNSMLVNGHAAIIPAKAKAKAKAKACGNITRTDSAS